MDLIADGKRFVKVGNTEGKYFQQESFDKLILLLHYVDKSLPNLLDSISMWYDPVEDFHHLSFKYCGVNVKVNRYKVFSGEIDGERLDGVIGDYTVFGHYLVRQIISRRNHLADHLPTPSGTN